ncbi:MAG: hypothetical protein SFX72_16010 [Isosphaeraceae bacterium]|nr:hypothetical protein [Isosphaeraceae bacterium]
MWKTSIRSGIPLLAAAAFGFGTATTMILQPEERLSAAPKPPAVSSFKGDFVAGLGELQPAGELVELGAEIAGIISRVDAVAGKHVQQGDILVEFESDLIESRLLRA